MKELNTFRQFVNETKENVDELFGRREDPIEKQASMVFSTIEFVDDLVSAGHVDKAFFDVFTEKMAEAYSSLMMGASPELQNKMGFEVDVDLEENDVALDEVINEGLDTKTKKYLYNTAGGFLDSTYFDDVKVGDELKFTFNAVDDEADLRTGPDFAKIGDKFVTFEEDGDTKYEVKKAGGDNYEIKITIKKEVE